MTKIRVIRKPVTLQALLSCITNANHAQYVNEDEAWTLRMLAFQFFRPSGNIGEHADDQLIILYARDAVEDMQEPIEAEVIAAHRHRDMVIGPIAEDKSPPDYRVSIVKDNDDGPNFSEGESIPEHIECSQ